MNDDHRQAIRLRGVRVHNLKGIDLDLPPGRLIAFTGVSGSGKSSLAFDTLYAEGQRRYIETFSPYTRQFLQALDKPDADRIEGIPPALAVAQQAVKRSGRSTVGTITEVHDHLALLYARKGRVFCRVCGHEIRPACPGSVASALDGLPEGTRYQIAFPLDVTAQTDLGALAAFLREEGFVRAVVAGKPVTMGDGPLPDPGGGPIDIVVDRLIRGREDPSRRADSIETACSRGLGRVVVLTDQERRTFYRGWRCGHCGTDQPEPEPRLFHFNSPLGACPACHGFGRIAEYDLARIVPDPSRSLEQGAIDAWESPSYRPRRDELIRAAPKLGIPIDRPFRELSPAQVRLVMEGGRGFTGVRPFFEALERKAYRMHVRVFLSRWRGYRTCPSCQGARLRPEALAVQFAGLNIAALSARPLGEAIRLLEAHDQPADPVGRTLLGHVLSRLRYLDGIGLGYLSLDRPARTLSGGESRRVALTTALGSGLVNTLYVLDEPSVGLHPRDLRRLSGAIQGLRDAGNTVALVEHDRALIRAADLAVDLGPGAGDAGGRLVCVAPPAELADCPESVTGAYLSGRKRIPVPSQRRPPNRGWLELAGASGNNLKQVDAAFPLGVLCVVTGVSGAGKSSLVLETLYPALARRLGSEAPPALPFGGLDGAEALGQVVMIDPSPIGRTPRSNPVTYLKAFDAIRRTFAETHEAKLRNYGAGRFSFNVEGGRCSACEGNGYQLIDMQFLPDVMVRCPECHGTRYRPEVLEVTYRGKNIAEVLDLTAKEAFAFFRHRPKVQAKLRPLIDVGLGYTRLGQPAPTLSGGEAQRLKLAAFLGSSAAAITRSASGPKTLFLLDEPTANLHPADVAVLLDALNRLVDLGHSVIIVEHNPDMMACADWIIDLGPDAGDEGGRIVAQGTPEEVARSGTHTGQALLERLEEAAS
jgi:excinuclease ABC subunit A